MTVEPLSDERLAEIRAGLVGCTPGPWVMEVETSERVDESGEDRQPEVYVCSSDTRCDYTVVATMGRAEAISHERKSWDAGHIARLDPQTVAALLARLDKAEAGWQDANRRFLIADKAAVTALERVTKAEAALSRIMEMRNGIVAGANLSFVGQAKRRHMLHFAASIDAALAEPALPPNPTA